MHAGSCSPAQGGAEFHFPACARPCPAAGHAGRRGSASPGSWGRSLSRDYSSQRAPGRDQPWCIVGNAVQPLAPGDCRSRHALEQDFLPSRPARGDTFWGRRWFFSFKIDLFFSMENSPQGLLGAGAWVGFLKGRGVFPAGPSTRLGAGSWQPPSPPNEVPPLGACPPHPQGVVPSCLGPHCCPPPPAGGSSCPVGGGTGGEPRPPGACSNH